MAQILVKARNNPAPTLREWRDWVESCGLPQAEGFLLENPYTEYDFFRAHAIFRYSDCKAILDEFDKGKVELKKDQLDWINSIISEIENDPPTPIEVETKLELIKADEKPSIENIWRDSKYMVDVESKKTDEEKIRELDQINRARYQKGYPVVVMPDDHIWGRMEGLPDFFVVKMPGVKIEEAKKYIEECMVFTGLDKEGRPIMKMQNRRKWKIEVDEFPREVGDKAMTVGEITINDSGLKDLTLDQAKQYFHDLVNDVREMSLDGK